MKGAEVILLPCGHLQNGCGELSVLDLKIAAGFVKDCFYFTTSNDH